MVDPDEPLTELPSGDDLTLGADAVDVSSWPGSLQARPTPVTQVHFDEGFKIVANWDGMEALVRYCYLLAWEAKALTIFSNKVPVSYQAFSTLVTIADKVKQAAEVANSFGRSFPDLPLREQAAVGDSGISGRSQRDATFVTRKNQTGVPKRPLPQATSPQPKRRATGLGASAVRESQSSDLGTNPRIRNHAEGDTAQQSAVGKSTEEGQKPLLCEATPSSPDVSPLSPPRPQSPAVPITTATTSASASTSTLATRFSRVGLLSETDVDEITEQPRPKVPNNNTTAASTAVGPTASSQSTVIGRTQPTSGRAVTPPDAGIQRKSAKSAQLSEPTALPPPKRRTLQRGATPMGGSDSDTTERDAPMHNSRDRSQSGTGVATSIDQTLTQADSHPSLTEAGIKTRRAWSAILGRSIVSKPREAERKYEDERRLMDALKKSRDVNDAEYKKAKANLEKLEEEFLKTHDRVEKWIKDMEKVDDELEANGDAAQ